MHPPRRTLTTLLVTGAGLLAAVPAASAAPVAVASGALANETVNVFGAAPASGQPAVNRTWLGYTTNSPGFSTARGTAAPIAPASGPTVTPTSERGADKRVAWSYPTAATAGTYDPATGDADLEFTGGVGFVSPAAPAGHGFAVSLEDPRVTIDGATKTGKLYATGDSAGSATTYDRSGGAVYDLDLSTATTTADACTGELRITGVVPKIATAGLVYPASSYGVGAGPDRTPNTFGTYTITAQLPKSTQPCVSATPTTGIDGTGEGTQTTSVSVKGAGFKTTGTGLYVFYAPVSAPFSTPTTAGVKPVWVPSSALPGDKMAADGSFAVTLDLAAKGGSEAGAFDCRAVACAIRTVAAHRDADPSQRTATPVTFTGTAPTTPAPTPTDTTPAPTEGTPGAGTLGDTAVVPTPSTPAPVDAAEPVAAAPKVTKLRLTRTRLTFRADRAGTVTATVQRRVVKRVKGKRVVRWRTLRTLEREVRRAGAVTLNPKLGRTGRFRVVLRTVSTTGETGKTTVVRKRVR